MFMFRSRRNALLKRLWRQAALRRGDIDANSSDQDDEEPEEQQVKSSWIKSAAHALFKRLSDDQLALLLDALDGAGVCIPVENGLEGAHRLLCRIFRWPELSVDAELKRVINLCSSSSICCNPYHWSRLSDVAPPPYNRLNHDRPARLPSYSVESLETGGTYQYSSTGSNLDGCGERVRLRPWCTLAYWELRQRVGRLLPVTQPSVAIFSDESPHRECALGLCLSALTSQIPPETDAVRRTRQKVESGLMLCQEPDGIWMYNRSENPVFVNSPTLDPPGTGPAGAPRTLLVYKVLPDFAIRVFDPERSLLYQQQCNNESLAPYRRDEDYTDGPFDPNALRISFAKGWGPKYSRQFITSCPCWLEVLLAPSR